MHRVLLFDVANAHDGGLGQQLAQCGFIVDEMASDVRCVGQVSGRPLPDVAVVYMDGRGGAGQHRSLRACPGVPTLVVCPRHNEALIVRWLDTGADSVVVAPVSKRELAARINALVARSRRGESPSARFGSWRVGDLMIDVEGHAVTKAGRAISLTPIEFRLLVALARRAGGVVSCADLLAEVWGAPDRDGPEHVRLYVRYLRRKLGEDPARPRIVVNDRGAGYKLVSARSER